MRLQALPKIIVPVLYNELAMAQFEAAVQQEPEYGNDVLLGYIPATIYWNRPETWQVLEKLADAGVIYPKAIPADRRTVWAPGTEPQWRRR